MKDKPNRREYLVQGTTAALGILAATEGARAQQAPAHEHHHEQAPSAQEGTQVESAGGTYVEKDWVEAHVDGKLVTAPAWPAHPAWLSALLKLLGTEIHHETTSVSIGC